VEVAWKLPEKYLRIISNNRYMSEKTDLPEGISIIDNQYRAELFICTNLLYSSHQDTLEDALKELEKFKKIRADFEVELAERKT
jgi:hypothetical protein